MDNSRYPANVFWSDEDEGFVATAPDLPGCSAFGESQAEALAELQDAIEAWIEASTAAGNLIPPPSTPAKRETYSGKVLLRMPRSLHADLVSNAEKDGVSLNQYVVYLLTLKMHRAATTAMPAEGLISNLKHPQPQYWRQITDAITLSGPLHGIVGGQGYLKTFAGTSGPELNWAHQTPTSADRPHRVKHG